MKNKENKDGGYLIVEAAVVYPIIIVLLVMFLYITLLFGQRAQMIYAAESTIIYLKEICMTDFDMDDFNIENNKLPTTAELINNTDNSNVLNAYKNIFNTTKNKITTLKNNGMIEKIFKCYMGTPLLIGVEPDVKVEVTSYFITTKLELTAKYEMKSPINFSFIGAKDLNKITLTANVQGMIQDNTENIRTLYYIKYLYNRSGLAAKVDEYIQKAKNWLGIGK